MMSAEFRDLEVLAQQTLDWGRSTTLLTQTDQFHDATLEEIVDLLNEAVAIYTVLAPTLPTHLLQSACHEVEFLTALCRQTFSCPLTIANQHL